jgi:hypothetical protein
MAFHALHRLAARREEVMNILLFLLGLIVGLGVFVWGTVQVNRRRGGFGLLAGGVLTMVAGIVAGVAVGDGANTTTASATGVPFAITAPVNLENLDAQDFLLEGTGPAGSSVELLRNDQPIGNVTVGGDNTWSYNVSRPQPGDYAFSLRGANVPANFAPIKVNVAPNRPDASNAKCPCQLRIEALAPAAKISLVQGDKVIGTESGPVFVFKKLDAGDYGVKVEAAGFKTFQTTSDKFVTPKNKNISVYLNK